ncbi:hypothetical protein [Demequina sp.]|uniref:variant leucine-rich repeat-containing protein n=1 Tax=Demequina sp. TaxID=2050685 RepID=UPI003D144121
MYWTSEALCVLVTGALFLAIVVAGLTPVATLNSASFAAFGAAGVVFIGVAFALARVQAVNYPPAMWALPILPLLIIGVLGKDAVAARRASHQPAHETAISRPDGERPLAALAVAHESRQGGEGSPQHLASSPDVTPNELAHIAINHPDLRPAVARNPLTPPSVLTWLAQQDDPGVAKALESRGGTTSAVA